MNKQLLSKCLNGCLILLSPSLKTAGRRLKAEDGSPRQAGRFHSIAPLLTVVALYNVYRCREKGNERLREYLAAPATVQAQFDRGIREQIEAEQDSERFFAASDSDDPIPPEQPASKRRKPVRWDEGWKRRSEITAVAASRPGEQRDISAERLTLMAVPPVEYVAALAGEEVEENRPAHCPLPDHDERTGSFYAYDAAHGWYCYGCSKGGTVYDFASALWGIPTRGAQFVELHKRLLSALGMEEQEAAA